MRTDRRALKLPVFGPWSPLMSVQCNEQYIVQNDMGCWDFIGMYTKLQHNDILESFAETLPKVWSYRATFAPEGAGDPMLSRKEWVYANGYTYQEVMA